MAADATPDPSPAISGMTGFAQASGAAGSVRWQVDVRSVNSRGLDLRLKLPAAAEPLEIALRALVQRHLRRGSVTLTITLEGASGPRLGLDHGLVAEILDLASRVAADPALAAAVRPSLDGLLGLRGVIVEQAETAATLSAQAQAALLASAGVAVAGLVAERRREGAGLAAVLSDQVAALQALCHQAATHADAQPQALAQRLRQQLDTLTQVAATRPVEAGRLEQELALQVVRADVREELDRLALHLATARGLLAAGSPAGRQLDFLCQELNREANTLCAKSVSAALTAIGLEMKLGIDRLREQAQNVE